MNKLLGCFVSLVVFTASYFARVKTEYDAPIAGNRN